MHAPPPTLAAGSLPVSGKLSLLVILSLSVALIAIRLLGPSDLMDNEQQRTAAYVMDAVQNHHWLCQCDEAGEITSKPPIYTWLAAGTTLLFSRINRLALCLPACLATAILAGVILRAGRASLGATVGFLAALIYLLSMPIVRQIGLARMDALFPLTTTWGALAAYNAWTRGRGWIWFWLACAAATLTKSPLGLLIAGGGLVAVLWESPSGPSLRLCRGWFVGLLFFLVITLGWFAASWHEMGRAVYDKLIIQELLGKALRPRNGVFPGEGFYIPPFQFLSRFAPWSLLTCLGLGRICLSPAQDPAERRFERFVFCWFMAGILPLCLATHQRSDLLLPVYPPAALLAGREAARWLAGKRGIVAYTLAGIAVAFGLALMVLKYDVRAISDPAVTQTVAARTLAGVIEQSAGRDFPLTHVDDPFALQFFLNTMRPLAWGPAKRMTGVFDKERVATYDYESAAQLLQSDAAAFVVVCNIEKLRNFLPANGIKIYEVAHEPLAAHDFHVLSNRPRLEPEDHMVMGVGPLRVETWGLRYIHAAEVDFTFAPLASGPGSLRISNGSSQPCPVRVRMERGGTVVTGEHLLQPAESWACE